MNKAQSLSWQREVVMEVVIDCAFPDYDFKVEIDGRGATYLQASYEEPDTVTGNVEKQVTRRWFLSPQMTRSEVVQTVFKCVMTSMEHRVREWFSYKSQPVFSPHFDVDELHSLCAAGYFARRNA